MIPSPGEVFVTDDTSYRKVVAVKGDQITYMTRMRRERTVSRLDWAGWAAGAKPVEDYEIPPRLKD